MPSTSQTADEIRAERRASLKKLRESTSAAYPNQIPAGIIEIRSAHSRKQKKVALAGRLNFRRKLGKATFANLADGSDRLDDIQGEEKNSIQIYASAKQDKRLLAWLNELHLGDIIYVEGNLFYTRQQELTVELTKGKVLAKCLEPYTHKDGLSETKQRKRRYLALAVTPGMRAQFQARSAMVSSIRKYFDNQDYLEVETPILHDIQGGALAKPFKTTHATLGREFCLRIAPELYLKRLLVGGFGKVYELGRTFRNEGMSDKHNPEFTMLEFYAPYRIYTDLMRLIEALLKELTRQDWYQNYHQRRGKSVAKGQLMIKGKAENIGDAFVVKTFYDCLCQELQLTKEQLHDRRLLLEHVSGLVGEKSKQINQTTELGYIHMLLFEKHVEHTLYTPTFVTEFPACVSPLARRVDGAPDLTERFELYVGGRELANGFSELNDPDEQKKVFQQQVLAAQSGDSEAMQYDEDYIRALSYGMPPAAGAGIGIDRLAMLLLELDSIRDAILFPQLAQC